MLCLDWTVDDYSSFSHISVITHLRDKVLNFFTVAQQPLVRQGLLSIEDSLSHTLRHTTLRHTTLRHTTIRHTTLGTIPPDNWSARSRDRYLTTHNTSQDIHSCSQRDSNPLFQEASGRKPTPTTEQPLGSAKILN